MERNALGGYSIDLFATVPAGFLIGGAFGYVLTHQWNPSVCVAGIGAIGALGVTAWLQRDGDGELAVGLFGVPMALGLALLAYWEMK